MAEHVNGALRGGGLDVPCPTPLLTGGSRVRTCAVSREKVIDAHHFGKLLETLLRVIFAQQG